MNALKITLEASGGVVVGARLLRLTFFSVA